MKLTELLTALLLAAALPAAAQMNYQGRLTDASGNPLADGQQTLEFSLWDLATGGTAALNQVWGPYTLDGSAGRPKADLASGRFNVVLGPLDATNRPLTGAFNGPRFIQIKVGTNAAISPRQQILAAPTALHADHATNADTAANFTSVVLKTDEVNARVGIGLANPAEKLDVAGNVKVTGNLAASGSVGIGIPPTPGVLLNVSNNGGANESLRLSGAAINATQGTSTQGISFLLGLNRDDLERTDLMIGNSRKLGANDSVLRIIPGLGNFGSLLASVTPDGSTFKDLGLQDGQMTIKANGNVGIGTTAPARRLHVVDNGNPVVGRFDSANTVGTWLTLGNSSVGGQFWKLISTGSANGGGAGTLQIGSGSSDFGVTNVRMTLDTLGRVGIGTATPTRAKLDIAGGGDNYVVNIGGFLNRNGASDLSNSNQTRSFSIVADSVIAGSEIFAFSDVRIKNIQGRSDGVADLAILSHIEVTDYTYIDKVTKGGGRQKKVIAQQVETVYPQAVSKSTDVVPDIYQKATVKDGWVALATDLKAGERVRLIGEKEEAIHDVLEVREGAFRTAFRPATETIFVYGREVKDFRSVDYEAIAMLNVSATQELARQLTAKDARIAALEKTVAALQAKDEARDTKLAAIEALLSSNATKPRTVSLSR